MKKLATMTAAAALMLGFAMSMGTSGALAASSSVSGSEAFHCYLFFTEVGPEDNKFAQASINGSTPEEVNDKAREIIEKYADDESAYLDVLMSVGNTRDHVHADDDDIRPACSPKGHTGHGVIE